MLHSKEGAAAAAEEWKRRGRRCCYGTIDARYLRKKGGRSGAEGRESRFLSRCSVALSPEKRERLTGQQRRRFVTVAVAGAVCGAADAAAAALLPGAAVAEDVLPSERATS